MKKIVLAAYCLCLFWNQAFGVTLTGIQEVHFEGAVGARDSAGNVLFRNLRIRSTQTQLADYLESSYTINPTTAALTLQSTDIYPGIGVFSIKDSFMAKDVPASITMTRASNGATYAMDTLHSLPFSNGHYFMNLVAGQVLSLHFAYPTTAMNIVLTAPSGKVVADVRGAVQTSNQHLVFNSLPIFETGQYRIDFVPVTGTSGGVTFRFLNENRSTTVTGTHNATMSATLRAYSREYAKIRIPLLANQTAVLSYSSSGAFFFSLSDQWGAEDTLGNPGTGSSNTFQFTALADGDYYTYIAPQNPVSSSNTTVNIGVQIQTALGFSSWASAHGISSLQKEPGQDADKDGATNIMEYTLGSSAVRPNLQPFTPVSAVGGQAAMTYTRPAYVTGISITPQQSTNLVNWAGATTVPVETTSTYTRHQIISSGAGDRKFLRLSVSQE